MERVTRRGRDRIWIYGRRVRWRLALTAWLVMAVPVLAQQGHAIKGTVTDETGAVLVGATVELTGAEAPRTLQTDERGQYVFTDVRAGEYVLSVSHAGFEPTAAHRRVPAQGSTIVDVSLRILVESEVDVASTAIPAERTASSLFSRSLSGDDIEELPSSRGAFQRRLQELSSATGRPGDVAMYVDGFRRVTRLPPKEAIQTIRISSNPFAAEFAEPGHTRVEIVTKAGFNRPSGELTFDYNDRALNARHAFAPERANMRMRNVSGYLSSPIVRSRWSLVAYGGRWQEDTSEVVSALVLDPATHAPTPFARAVITPSLVDNLWLGSHQQVATAHTLALSAGHTREERQNQGLDEGVDLPERAFTSEEEENLGRLSLTSALGPRLFNELRGEVTRKDSGTRALTDAPAVDVLDAFSAGGNQNEAHRATREETLFVSNQLTLSHGRSTFKVGASADLLRQHDSDRAGFGGRFVFGADVERDADGRPVGGASAVDPLEVYRRTLLGESGYGPSQFSVVRGDPDVAFTQWWADWFAQGEWTPTSTFSLSYGVRHDLQSDIPWQDGLNPRLGVAWSPGGGNRDVIRLGAGTFTGRVPARVTLDSLRLDGTRTEWLIVRDPTFFPDLPEDALSEAVVRTRATQGRDPGMHAPRLLRASLTYDRRLAANLFASTGYLYEHGSRLLRTRNLNAPTGGELPWPDRGAVLQYESSGRSRRHELLVALRTQWSRAVSAFVNYTLGSSRSDTDDVTTRPADSNDLAREFGWHRLDARHQATAGVTLRLPREWIVSAFAVARSGRPFNITTGRDNNDDTIFMDRPAFGSPDDPDAIATPFGTFDPSPEPGDLIIPRNYGREPADVRLDLHVQKAFRLGPGRTRLRLGADAVNLLNRANRARLNGVLTSPTFGTARRARDPRRIDLFLGVSF